MREATDIAEEICGCADREQRKRDEKLIKADREQASLEERAKIVAWLMKEEIDYKGTKYAWCVEIVRKEIKEGEHLK